MAVRVPIWLRDALRWRWTPTIALVAGSLIYVLGATVLVPSEITFSSNDGPKGSVPGDDASLSNSEETVNAPAPGTDLNGDSPRIRSRRRARQAVTETPSEAPSPPTELTAPAAPPAED